MEMVKMAAMYIAVSAIAAAADFAIAVGNPIAANMPRMKMAAFAVRLENCASDKRSIEGTAEGILNGEPKSVALTFIAAETPGVYAVPQTLPRDGKLVMVLRATCGDDTAGAIVPVNAQGIVRESSKFFSRAPKKQEIEEALKEGGSK